VAEALSAGDAIPADGERIEVHVPELSRLFDMMDPSPFGQRDLDPRALEYIVNWARETSGRTSLALLVHLDRGPGRSDEAAILGKAVREFFSARAVATRHEIRHLLRVGRISLGIGVLFLVALSLAGDMVVDALRGQRIGELLRESLLIGGWVAMWRPMEIFLYEWWPIWSEARLFRRLSRMPVRITYRSAEKEAWRHDWPEETPEGRTA
jgi:hypothetical protein